MLNTAPASGVYCEEARDNGLDIYYKGCGSPCQVRAINSIGEINANECHYCLDCQVTYYNEHKCPPMVDKRKRREKSVRAREVLVGMESVIGASGLDKIDIRPSSACDDCTQVCKDEN